MALPWKVLDQFMTKTEGILELRQRGKGDFLITLGPQVLMNSKAQRSEMALGILGCKGLDKYPQPRVLVGGLGMAITLRAVLDQLPETAEVVVAELNPIIHQWCLGPLAELTGGAAVDPRVKVEIGDVAQSIKTSVKDTIYGSRAIAHTFAALKPGGTLAVWGENPDRGFEGRLASGGFTVRCERPGKGGYRHAVWIAKKRNIINSKGKVHGGI